MVKLKIIKDPSLYMRSCYQREPQKELFSLLLRKEDDFNKYLKDFYSELFLLSEYISHLLTFIYYFKAKIILLIIHVNS
jgi:hypothetical protein